MKQLFGMLMLLVAISIPAFSQLQRMSPEDQDKFQSYYSRWVQDKQMNDRDDMISMEQRMQDLMAKYGVPSNTPYDEVAAQSGYQGYGRDRAYPGPWQGRLSSDDQNEFNKEYRKWQDAMVKHDQDDIDKHARKMQQLMMRNNIPASTPFDAVATTSGSPAHYDPREFRGRLAPDDQTKFDKAYEHWLKDRRKGDRDDIAKDEGKMQEIMSRYNIPRDVPYEAVASGGGAY